MYSVICTLFEGHYHYGLVALTNSLYKNGFRGSIYAGYRGLLPDWATNLYNDDHIGPGTQTFEVANGLQIHFIPLITNIHFTNYKMDFMLDLFNGPAKNASGIVYFDPDIIIKCKWDFFDKWISHGVAVVHEITANDMPYNHPVRKEWEKVISKRNLAVKRNLNSYLNAGFCGISKDHIEFLKIWSLIMRIAENDYGYENAYLKHTHRTDPFFAGDQDAFNMAAMCCESPLSEMGPEGMDLTYGGFTMSHAIGSPKPWKKNFLYSAILGNKPSIADKAFWLNMKFPIKCFDNNFIKRKQLSIAVASFIGRFYRQS